MADMGLPAGIGNAQQAMQATAFIRNQPWYQQMVRGWGLDPNGDANGNVHLNSAQQDQLLQAARAHGIGISDSYQIDQNGQIANVPSHLLRNILIGAGIGGAALTGIGAAGIGPLAGLFGGGAAASAAPAALSAGSLPGFAGVPAATGTIADLGTVSPAMFGGAAASTAGPLAGDIGSIAGSGITNSALSAGGAASPLMKALAGIGGIAGGAIGGKIGQAGAVPQQLTDLLNTMSQRTQAQTPLFNAVNSGLYQMLPSFAKTGGPPTAV